MEEIDNGKARRLIAQWGAQPGRKPYGLVVAVGWETSTLPSGRVENVRVATITTVAEPSHDVKVPVELDIFPGADDYLELYQCAPEGGAELKGRHHAALEHCLYRPVWMATGLITNPKRQPVYYLDP